MNASVATVTGTMTSGGAVAVYADQTAPGVNDSDTAGGTITWTGTVSAPSLTLPANATINELVAYSANASDSDSDVPANNLTYALVSGPSGLTVSSAGAIANSGATIFILSCCHHASSW